MGYLGSLGWRFGDFQPVLLLSVTSRKLFFIAKMIAGF